MDREFDWGKDRWGRRGRGWTRQKSSFFHRGGVRRALLRGGVVQVDVHARELQLFAAVLGAAVQVTLGTPRLVLKRSLADGVAALRVHEGVADHAFVQPLSLQTKERVPCTTSTPTVHSNRGGVGVCWLELQAGQVEQDAYRIEMCANRGGRAPDGGAESRVAE